MSSFSHPKKIGDGLMNIMDDPVKSPIGSVNRLISEMAPRSTQATHPFRNKTSIKNMANNGTRYEGWCDSIHSSNNKESAKHSTIHQAGAPMHVHNKFSQANEIKISVDGVSKQLSAP